MNELQSIGVRHEASSLNHPEKDVRDITQICAGAAAAALVIYRSCPGAHAPGSRRFRRCAAGANLIRPHSPPMQRRTWLCRSRLLAVGDKQSARAQLSIFLSTK